MAQFSKQEVVDFNAAATGFQDSLTISGLFGKFKMDAVVAERSLNTVWRPMPYIVQSYSGVDQTANFNRDYVQMSVPTSLNMTRTVPLTMSALELRDAAQRGKLGNAAMQRLSSDINIACSNLACGTGAIFVKRANAPTGYDDIAEADNAMNRVGIETTGRQFLLPSAHYNSMAGNLAARVLDNSHSAEALRKAYLGEIAGFETYKAQYSQRLTAAAGVGVSITAANSRLIPRATSTGAGGEVGNVDNRFQVIGITVTSGAVKVGDAFQIAGVNEVHHITKIDTGRPKTFRVQAIITGAGGTGTISMNPPVICPDGGSPTDGERQYQNVTTTPAAGAAVTFLNTSSTGGDGLLAPFWHESCFEICAGRYEPDADAGMPVLAMTTDQGITVTMTKQADINQLNTKYRWDIYYGLVNLNPQMSGVAMFGQP